MAYRHSIIFLFAILFRSQFFAATSSRPRQQNSNYVSEENNNDGSYDFLANKPSLFFRTMMSDSRPAFEAPSSSAQTIISVDQYGARGDGTHDDTEAFQKAWKQACSLDRGGVANIIVVPNNKKYLLNPITFSGPCKSKLIGMKIYGTILASTDRSVYGEDRNHWIMFDSVQNLMVEGGGGTIHGNGNTWWQNSCKTNRALPCRPAPTALTFYNCMNLKANNLKIKDSPQMHVRFEKCVNVQASYLVITAPENSPNTDGIHITNSQDVQLSNCNIATGDDCISIVSGSENVKATSITCGPGHGISIGSLGAGNGKAHVSNITIEGAKISRTTNGVRIKTYQGGFGSASNIKFLNIQMENVKNPIIIDQHYCDQAKPCKEQQRSDVQVKDVLYQNIKGTSTTNDAITFDCSKYYPCQSVVLQDVNLLTPGKGNAKALCANVELTAKGIVSPHCP